MVRCADCGFLTMRNKFTGELGELGQGFRDEGTFPTRIVLYQHSEYGFPAEHRQTAFEPPLLCFVQAHDLQSELPAKRSADASSPASVRRSRDKEDILRVIRDDRVCPPEKLAAGFVQWKQGFTPKEHRDALDREEAREYELRRDIAIRDREDARDKRADDWHMEQMNALEEQHIRELLIFGGLIGLATISAGILDGVVSRGVDLWPF